MFLSARYRPNVWPFWVMLAFEFGLTVALLALVGIASPNLYRTKLWADGAENGFNSSPKTGMYAAANYRPYKTPKVWSQFVTNYNLVVVVLSMFLMLVKSIMYMLHAFPPIVNCILHFILAALYTVSIYYQASSDMSDPRAPQPGAPWYITKSCSVAKHINNVGYCKQAKATFGCFMAMLMVFVIYFGFALFSCFPSRMHMVEYATKKREREEKYAGIYSSPEEPPKTARSIAYTVPETPGIENLNPITPRTFAFNKLSGTKNVPMYAPTTEAKTTEGSGGSKFSMRNPSFPRLGKKAASSATEAQAESGEADNSGKAPMYFPPPPTSPRNNK